MQLEHCPSTSQTTLYMLLWPELQFEGNEIFRVYRAPELLHILLSFWTTKSYEKSTVHYEYMFCRLRTGELIGDSMLSLRRNFCNSVNYMPKKNVFFCFRVTKTIASAFAPGPLFLGMIWTCRRIGQVFWHGRKFRTKIHIEIVDKTSLLPVTWRMGQLYGLLPTTCTWY